MMGALGLIGERSGSWNIVNFKDFPKGKAFVTYWKDHLNEIMVALQIVIVEVQNFVKIATAIVALGLVSIESYNERRAWLLVVRRHA